MSSEENLHVYNPQCIWSILVINMLPLQLVLLPLQLFFNHSLSHVLHRGMEVFNMHTNIFVTLTTVHPSNCCNMKWDTALVLFLRANLFIARANSFSLSCVSPLSMLPSSAVMRSCLTPWLHFLNNAEGTNTR